MTTTAVAAVPGLAGEILAAYGDRARVHDLYDPAGAPVYHDLAAADTTEIRELTRSVRAVPGTVLELAAGSGRLTLPLLALGREVTALELKESMVDLLRERLAEAPAGLGARCTVVQGDMSAFDLGARFAVVVLGTTSISLLDADGRAGLYAAVRAHLEPGGRFLFSTVDVRDDGEDLDLEATGASGRRYRMIEHWRAGQEVREVTILAPEREIPATGPVPVFTTAIRVLPPDDLARELAAAGLRVVARHPLPAASARHTGVLLEAEAA
ncbi:MULTISPECIES: daptide-type RiPP biosynthesis methyltransferase [unclassified Streptomyces]|uniref:daptide-type RiPP biosynthesis methyltransferase n=1 Tax=unclassified Streptomyces TaxID=2593676 RepID=UPI000DD59F4F|nr:MULTISPECIES: daptide-type RiPP biosynthesis methyltransferase [unclassified Streptomyces]QZZ28973.1 class I SAM-dependent methyltransferase [Streptomyces sp. ST1015]